MSELRFERPVARHLVHRAAMAEVFVCDGAALGDDRFLVAAQWPRDHALYYPDPAGLTDTLLFAETIRQAMVYLAHQFHGIPLTHHFIGRRIAYEIPDPGALRVGPVPLAVVLEARWTWTDHRPPGRYDFRVDVDLLAGGVRHGHGSIEAFAVDARRYGVLRRRAADTHHAGGGPPRASTAGDPVDAAEVGRQRQRDSVLRRDTGQRQWWLAPDRGHAILFDHPTDHLPLIVLAEGFRQLGHLLTGERTTQPPALSAMSIDCHAFGELEEPARLQLTGWTPAPGGGHGISVDARQRGTQVASCAMRWLTDVAPIPAQRRAPAGSTMDFGATAARHG